MLGESGCAAWARVPGRVGWCYVCVCCESGFSVYMAGPGICILCYADFLRILGGNPVFNPVAPYRDLLPNLYLSVADITYSDLACRMVVRPWISPRHRPLL